MSRVTPIAYEGIETCDKRTLACCSLWWKELPLPIFRMVKGSDSRRIGSILELSRDVDSVVWATMDIEMPEGYCLSLDGGDAVLEYGDENENGGFSVLFKSMRVFGGTLIPIETWAWNES